MRLLIDPVWSWPLISLASVAMLVIVVWSARTSFRRLTRGYRRLLIGLRLCAALLLIAAMFRPAIEIVEKQQRRAQLAFLLDMSRSMSTADMPGGLTRREALVKLLQEKLGDLSNSTNEVLHQARDVAANAADSARTVKGSVTFVSDTVVMPVIGVAATVAGAKRFVSALFQTPLRRGRGGRRA